MDKAVTVGGVVTVILCIVGAIGVFGALVFILDLMNPFRSGH